MGIQKILVAVDGSKHSKKALDFAVNSAVKENAALYMLYVLSKDDLPPEVVKFIREERIDAGLGKLSARIVGEKILKPLAEQARTAGVGQVHARVERGDPADEIVKFARKNEIDLLVMGSRGLGKIRGLLLGSVSTKVCQLVECTCVTVK